MKAAIGAALVVLHLCAFAIWVPSCRRPELALEYREGVWQLPAELRQSVHREPQGNAMKHDRYVQRFRGGFTRAVGTTTLPPPFQDPAARACVGRVVVGQRLLDDGNAGDGTIAGQMSKLIAAELQGENFVGAGDFQRVEKTQLRWAELSKHPDDAKLVEAAPHGYVRAEVKVVFEHMAIPIVVALVPAPTKDSLQFTVKTQARLEFGNRLLDWASAKLGGDKLATRLARREIDASLVTVLAPPPPFTLPGGHKIAFAYCDGPIEIVDGVSGALPFSVLFESDPRHPDIRPPRGAPAEHAPLAPNGTLAIDLDIDGANALLYELWRIGFLDRELAHAGLDKQFNSDPFVQDFLSLRIAPPTLAMPPVVDADGDHLALYADARVVIRDGGLATIGRVWGGLEFKPPSGRAKQHREPVEVALGPVELSCEQTTTRLVPCYGDLVDALHDRGAELQGELTRTFTKLVDDIFVDQRIGDPALPADLVIRAATASVAARRSLHLELDTVLAAKR